mmetsp:Transcript_27968/g.65760  ORF Transcript_27968/g.65760 Transcript_27968/m.65760 type:complete len:247 (+) Transcript_27968:283-1023(+)
MIFAVSISPSLGFVPDRLGLREGVEDSLGQEPLLRGKVSRLVGVDHQGRLEVEFLYLGRLKDVADADRFPLGARPENRVEARQEGLELLFLAVFLRPGLDLGLQVDTYRVLFVFPLLLDGLPILDLVHGLLGRRVHFVHAGLHGLLHLGALSRRVGHVQFDAHLLLFRLGGRGATAERARASRLGVDLDPPLIDVVPDPVALFHALLLLPFQHLRPGFVRGSRRHRRMVQDPCACGRRRWGVSEVH